MPALYISSVQKLLGTAVFLCICFFVVPVLAQANAACRTETFNLANDPSRGTYTLQNCTDNASVGQINTVLSNTDAAYFTVSKPDFANMRSTDIYLSNNEWVVWIDQTVSPGIVRGLWPIDKNGNPYPANQWVETKYPGGSRLRSILQPYRGFGGNASSGYGGLHVEIWRELGYQFYTYQHVGAAPQGMVRNASGFFTYYCSQLSGYQGTTYTDPVTGQQRRLQFCTSYELGPNLFRVNTALGATDLNGASADTHLKGHAGGLLLITNRACPPYNNCLAYSYGVNEIRDNAFHSIKPINLDARDAVILSRPNCTPLTSIGYDMHPVTCPSFDGSEDRYVAIEHYNSPNLIWQIFSSRPGVNFYVKPGWAGGKTWSAKLIASHYNDGRLGLTGFNSVDIVSMAPNNGSILINNSAEGQLRWSAEFTRTIAQPTVAPTAIPTATPRPPTAAPTVNPNISPGRVTLTPIPLTPTTRPPTAVPTATPRPPTTAPTTTTAPGQPTSTPRPPTAAPTGLPTSIVCQTSRGDANCNGVVDSVDYAFWKTKYTGGTIPADIKVDFNNDGKVNLFDLEIWTKSVYK